MIDRVCKHCAHQGNLVDLRTDVRQQFADPGAGLAHLAKLELGRGHREFGLPRGHRGQTLTVPHRLRQVDAEVFVQIRFIIPSIEL